MNSSEISYMSACNTLHVNSKKVLNEGSLEEDAGIITTDGKFYSCKKCNHINLVIKLVGKYKVGFNEEHLSPPDYGWITVSRNNNSIVGNSLTFLLPDILTRPQIDKMWDWCLIHGNIHYPHQEICDYEYNGQIKEGI